MLDVQTLLATLILMDGLLAATLWAAIARDDRPGLLPWTLALGLHALMFVAFALRNEETMLASVLVVNACAPLSLTLQADAILRFFNRRLVPWAHAAAPGAIAASMLMLQRSDVARVTVGGLLYGSGLIAMSVLVHRIRESERGLGTKLLCTGYAVGGAVLYARAATALTGAELYEGFRGEGVIAVFSSLFAFGVSYVTSIGFLLMNRERNERMVAHLAMVDGLTGTFNRRTFFNLAAMEVSRAVRNTSPVSLVLLDLDHFKRVNDAFGHQAGDAVLQRFVEVVRGCLRREDILTRYGGEEFCVLLPATTPMEARTMAERVRGAVEAAPFEFGGQWIEVTVSVGVSTLHPAEARVESLLRRADEALYRAKRDGRNRVAYAG